MCFGMSLSRLRFGGGGLYRGMRRILRLRLWLRGIWGLMGKFWVVKHKYNKLKNSLLMPNNERLLVSAIFEVRKF
jgi:hypothetical protein